MDLHDAWKTFVTEPSEESFQPLYDGTKRLVWTLCVRILGDEIEAQDAFQGAYASILVLARQRATTDGDGRFSWDELSPGKHVVSVIRKLALGQREIELHLRRHVELFPGDDRAIELARNLGSHQIHGRISGMDSSESLAITVSLRPLFDAEGEELRFQTYKEWDWRYKCAYLRAGRYSLEVAYWDAGATRTDQLEPIEISGDGERDLEVPGEK